MIRDGLVGERGDRLGDSLGSPGGDDNTGVRPLVVDFSNFVDNTVCNVERHRR